MSSRATHSDGEDDLAFSVAIPDRDDRLTGLAERVRPANDRLELPALQEFSQEQEVSLVRVLRAHTNPLRHDHREKRCLDEEDACTRKPAIVELTAVRHQGSLPIQRSQEV